MKTTNVFKLFLRNNVVGKRSSRTNAPTPPSYYNLVDAGGYGLIDSNGYKLTVTK